MYSNLLSDNDINQLYNVAAQTNKNGETYAYSIVEGSSPKINKTGIVEGKEFVESNNSLKLSKNSISSNNFIEI